MTFRLILTLVKKLRCTLVRTHTVTYLYGSLKFIFTYLECSSEPVGTVRSLRYGQVLHSYNYTCAWGRHIGFWYSCCYFSSLHSICRCLKFFHTRDVLDLWMFLPQWWMLKLFSRLKINNIKYINNEFLYLIFLLLSKSLKAPINKRSRTRTV